MKNPVKVSAVIITYNEERNISRCLDSLRAVADEIIVVDSFSTDATEALCAEHNVKFVKQKWLGYSKQKNFANTLVTNDYIFSIDADEALSPELIEAVKKMKANPEYDVYRINRLTNYCGKWIRHCGWYPDKKLRIWKRGKAEWQGEIHETLGCVEGATVSELQGDLLHYSYHSIKDHLNQINLFTELMAEEAFKKGKNASVLKLLFGPVVKFFKSFVFQLGFLDGYYGFVVSFLSAQTTFYKYLKIRELFKTNSSTPKS